jgi:hypothetical protein
MSLFCFQGGNNEECFPLGYDRGDSEHFHPEDGAICSSETSILTRAIQGHIPEDSILHLFVVRVDKMKAECFFGMLAKLCRITRHHV